MLVNGKGAIDRDGNRGGQVVDFRTTNGYGYISGEAENAYGERLNKLRRHLLMIRPSILIVADDLVAPEPSSFQWLLHALEGFEIDAANHTLVSRRKGACLRGYLFGSTDFTLTQTDAWPLAPDVGFPTVKKPWPERRWHFTAETQSKTERYRIAAIFAVRGPGEPEPEFTIETGPDRVIVSASVFEVAVDLSVDCDHILSLTGSGEELGV